MGNLTRRTFLKGSALGLTALGGLRLGFNTGLARADWEGNRFIVFVFLRGGMDGLNFVAPIAGPDRAIYEAKRPTIHLRTSGETAALPLGGNFGLHFAATGLHELYQARKLALVHGIGFPSGSISRSHFDAQDYVDLGTPGELHTPSGWLTRHLESTGQVPDNAQIPALCAGSAPPDSLLGRRDTMTCSSRRLLHVAYSSAQSCSRACAARSIVSRDAMRSRGSIGPWPATSRVSLW